MGVVQEKEKRDLKKIAEILQKGERSGIELGRVGSVDSSHVLTPSFQSPATSWRNSMLLQGL